MANERPRLRLLASVMLAAVVGGAATLLITGGVAPYTIELAAGRMPRGLSIDQGTGAITGAPVAAGTWNPTIRVIDSKGNRARKEFSLTVVKVTAAYCERTMVCEVPTGAMVIEANRGN